MIAPLIDETIARLQVVSTPKRREGARAMGSRNGRNGRSGTHSKLDRHNLEDFRPHAEKDEAPARADEVPAGATERSDNRVKPLAQRSRVAEKTQATAGEDNTKESLEDKLERRSAVAVAYQPLGDFLEKFSADTVMITFPALENMLKRKLPPSARERESWWTNRPRTRGHARAWRDAGWSVEKVDLKKGRVTFTRHAP